MGQKLSVRRLCGRIAEQANDVLGSVNNGAIHKPKKIILGICLALDFSSAAGIESPVLGTVFLKSEKLERAERKAVEMTGSSEILSSEKGQKEVRLKKKMKLREGEI